MIGLGRMGANMIQRLLNGSHQVVGYARRPESVQRVEKIEGAMIVLFLLPENGEQRSFPQIQEEEYR